MELGLEVDDSRSPYTVLAVKGEVDVYSAPRLREKLVELVSEGHRQIVVDLEGVDFLDSTGLGVLVGGLKRLRSHGGDLSLVCTQARILKVFEITGLTTVFSIASTVDEATGRLSTGRGAANGPFPGAAGSLPDRVHRGGAPGGGLAGVGPPQRGRERIDDLKLAVSEACTNAIEANVASSGGRPARGRPGAGKRPSGWRSASPTRARASIPSCCREHPPVTDPDRLNFERGLGHPADPVAGRRASASNPVRRARRCG